MYTTRWAEGHAGPAGACWGRCWVGLLRSYLRRPVEPQQRAQRSVALRCSALQPARPRVKAHAFTVERVSEEVKAWFHTVSHSLHLCCIPPQPLAMYAATEAAARLAHWLLRAMGFAPAREVGGGNFYFWALRSAGWGPWP